VERAQNSPSKRKKKKKNQDMVDYTQIIKIHRGTPLSRFKEREPQRWPG
jgi:hypothetical protein